MPRAAKSRPNGPKTDSTGRLEFRGGQDKWARRQQPKQSNATVRRLAIINRAIEATAVRDSALKPREAIPQSASEARDNFGPEDAATLSLSA